MSAEDRDRLERVVTGLARKFEAMKPKLKTAICTVHPKFEYAGVTDHAGLPRAELNVWVSWNELPTPKTQARPPGMKSVASVKLDYHPDGAPKLSEKHLWSVVDVSKGHYNFSLNRELFAWIHRHVPLRSLSQLARPDDPRKGRWADARKMFLTTSIVIPLQPFGTDALARFVLMPVTSLNGITLPETMVATRIFGLVLTHDEHRRAQADDREIALLEETILVWGVAAYDRSADTYTLFDVQFSELIPRSDHKQLLMALVQGSNEAARKTRMPKYLRSPLSIEQLNSSLTAEDRDLWAEV